MEFEGFPYVIGWELTLKCNLRCSHCGSRAGIPRKNELSLDEALSICDQLPELLVQEVDFTGGEPLLYPGWEKIANRLRDHNITTKILTNGLDMNLDTIARIKDTGIAGVGISIDGLEKTHDYIRGYNGLFKTILPWIEKILAAGIPVTAITSANALNIDELQPLFKQLYSIGIPRWQIQPIFHLGRVNESSELKLTDGQYIQLGNFVREWKPKAEEVGLKMLPADSYGYFTELDPREPPWNSCPAGLLSCGITSHGKVKGCLSLPDELTEGDLRERDLWSIWFSPDSFSYTRRFSKEDLGKSCQSCDKGEQCFGGCSAMSYGATGKFHNDPYCFYRIQNS